MSDQPESAFRQTSVLSAARALLDLGYLPKAEPPVDLVPSSQKAGDFIGLYRLVAPLGEGGFGAVWQAEQTEPIHRELALKLIKPGLDSREIIARFEAERQALALMDHPNIAAVLDAGTTDEGRPYFAMELVKGEPITTYSDRRRLGIDERLALFIPVCRAVQHAHQKSVLHRDLKPSNILVATVDGKPVPKVIDFGIAKALVGSERNALADLEPTQAGVAIGTPRYMSPEQAGSMPDVDTRSDIYSLGVVLCELLTGQSPHPAQPAAFLDALRWIRETEAVKPSTLAQNSTPQTEEAAERRGLDARRLARRLKGDLDWITLKALEKDRMLRYETATALARDLERHLADETVSAAAPTLRYQFGKFARRQRGALIAASLVVAALVVGTVVSLWQASVAKQSRREAEQSRREAEHRYTQARDAVDKYLVRVTDNPKLKQTDFVDLQRELLETAMPFYEDLGRYHGDDPKLRAERAWALAQLADIALRMGEFDKAEAAYRQTMGELSKLAAQFPNETDLQLRLGRVQGALAQLLRMRGRFDDSLAEYNEAVKTVEALSTLLRGNPLYEYLHAQVYNNRAITLDAMDRGEAAIESLRAAAAIGEKLVKQDAKIADYRLILAAAAGNEAGLLHGQQRYVEEVSERRRALEYCEAAAKTRADTRDYQELLANSRGSLGTALDFANQPAEAEPILRKGVTELQALVDGFPSFRSYREGLINWQRELSRNLFALQKYAESDAALEQVRVNEERLVRDFPGEARYAQELTQTVASQSYRAKLRQNPAPARNPDPSAAVALSPAGYAEEVKRARELAALHPMDWESLESAAEGMAGAVASIRADNKLNVEARDKQVDDCAAQAVDFLKQAMAKGYTGVAYFNTLPCAKSLQQRSDYRGLLVAPVKPPAHSPRVFRFEYRFDDPGPRIWVRDGVTWTETQPSGIEHVYTIDGPIVVDGIPGTKLSRMSLSPQTVFVPDLDQGKTQYLLFRQSDGRWAHLAPMTNREQP